MPRLLFAAILLAFAFWSWKRARETKDFLRNYLVAFWILLLVYQFLRSPFLLMLAFVCLALYWGLAIRRRNRILNGLKEIQEIAGLSGEAIKGVGGAAPKRLEETETASGKEEANLVTQARTEPFELVIAMDEERSFSAENAGLLCVKPGSTEIQIKMEPSDWGEGIVGIRCRTYICDADGQEWMAESLVAPQFWLEKLDAPADAAFVKWSSAPSSWLKAMEKNCAVGGLTDLRDSREYHELQLDGVTYPFFDKYQMPVVDLAWLSEENLWLVRARRIRRDDRDDPPGFHGEEEIPPFAWTASQETCSLLLRPDEHVVNHAAFYEMPEDRSEKVTFRVTGRRGRPQPNVTLAKPN